MAAGFLLKLHACLQLNSVGDALRWVDGARFTVQLADKGTVAAHFGSTALKFRRMLEALDFQLQEQQGSEVLLATHSEFSRWAIPNIDKMIARSSRRSNSSSSSKKREELLRMPEISYNSALNPLEVRFKCSGAAQSCSELWQVVVASSLKTAVKAPEEEESCFVLQEGGGYDSECGEESSSSGDDECFGSERCPLIAAGSSEDRDPESYRWISHQSESPSLCLDDLTDIDILSQISTYYG